VSQETEKPPREPMLNAPWASLAVVGALLAAYIVQVLLSPLYTEAYALSSGAVASGRWEVLITHIFLHGGIGHLLMNCGAAIAFGPPVARLYGPGFRGAMLYFAFFLLCGVLSGLGFAALHANDQAAAIGASGAISGVWGAATRLIERRGAMSPIVSRTVLIQAVIFGAINVAIGFLGNMAGYGIAWEAHIAGYAVGLFLIGPFARLAGRA